MAVNSPDLNLPLTPFRIVLYPRPLPSETEKDKSMNCMSIGGLFGKCVREIIGFLWPLGLLLGTLRRAEAGLEVTLLEDPLHMLFWEPLEFLRLQSLIGNI